MMSLALLCVQVDCSSLLQLQLMQALVVAGVMLLRPSLKTQCRLAQLLMVCLLHAAASCDDATRGTAAHA